MARTFSVVVAVDVERVEQLVVVVSHEIHGSGAGLDDADHLHKHNTGAGPLGMRKQA